MTTGRIGMQLSKQEDLVLERMALHMASTGDMDIGRAVDAIRAQDLALLGNISALSNTNESIQVGGFECDGKNALATIQSGMAARIYKKLRTTPAAKNPAADGRGGVTFIAGRWGKHRDVRYIVDGRGDAYVSFEALQLHMKGICKEGCPRCALER